MRTNYPFKINRSETTDGERQTYLNLMDESTYLYGEDVLYIDVVNAQLDEIYGEFLSKTMKTGTELRLTFDESEDDFYVQDAGMFQKFGYVPEIGEGRFNATKQYFEFYNVFPKEGDLLYYFKTNKMFEIQKVVTINGVYYQLNCKHYNFSHEDIDMDEIEESEIQSLDNVMDEEIENLITPVHEVVEREDIVDDSERDGLFS